MPKTSSIKLNLEESLMAKINSHQIKMKPRWYFYLGSTLLTLSFSGLTVLAIFFLNLLFFTLRQHGPRGELRWQYLLSIFPWWLLIATPVSLVMGIWLLKKFDFSYQKNFPLIVIGFLVACLLAAITLNYLGFNDFVLRRGQMMRFRLY